MTCRPNQTRFAFHQRRKLHNSLHPHDPPAHAPSLPCWHSISELSCLLIQKRSVRHQARMPLTTPELNVPSVFALFAPETRAKREICWTFHVFCHARLHPSRVLSPIPSYTKSGQSCPKRQRRCVSRQARMQLTTRDSHVPSARGLFFPSPHCRCG